MANPFRLIKRLIKLSLVLGVLGLALAWGAPYLIDTNRIKDIVVAQAKSLTGHELAIKGEVKFQLLPDPQLTLNNVELLSRTDPQFPAPTLRADSIQIDLQWNSIFSNEPSIGSVTIMQPTLGIEVAKDGKVYWDWLRLPGGSAVPATFIVQGGQFLYYDPNAAQDIRADNINLLISPSGNGVQASGSMMQMGRNLSVTATIPGPAPDGTRPAAEVRLAESEQSFIVFTAAPVQEGTNTVWRGKVDGKTDDIQRWVKSPSAPHEEEEASITQKAVQNYGGTDGAARLAQQNTGTAYPLVFSSQLEFAAGTVKLTDMAVETSDTKGKGNFSFTFTDMPTMGLDMHFEKLTLSGSTFRYWFAAAPDVGSGIVRERPGIPKGFVLNLDLKTDMLLIDQTQFAGGELVGALKDGQFDIGNVEINLGNETSVSLSGAIVDTAKGLRFQGRTETGGKDMRRVLALFDSAAERLPERSTQDFLLKANIFISADQLRLSEAELKLSDLKFQGGMVTYFEATPRVEAEISLRDINLDYFRDSWRLDSATAGDQPFIFAINSSVDFSWLKQLGLIVDLKVQLDRFTFLESPGDVASFRLYARKGEIGLHNIDIHYPEGSITGTITAKSTSDQPVFDVNLSFPSLDTAYFTRDPTKPSTPLMSSENPKERWSTDIFDMSWMLGVAGKLNLAIYTLRHHGEAYQRFNLQADLSSERMAIQQMSFERFGGRIDLAGTLIGGKVPGLSASFTVYNTDVTEFTKNFSNIEALKGRMSLSGTVTTSGINFREWVKQADVKMVLAARGLKAEGFNLQGIVDGVNASRSVADVVTNVNKALPAGSTEFSVDGNLNIQGGIVRTPGVTVQAGYSIGVINGEIQLLPWRMALNTLFQMKMFQSETVPTLTVDLTGSPDNYDVKIDTTSLEAYVAKRIVGR